MANQEKSTRQAFGEALVTWGEKHPEIVVLDADLSKSTKSDLFAKKFPARFIEMGIAEANMIGTAAGLSFTGKLPFLCSFGCFLTGRYDQIRLSCAYSRANVRLVGTHAGLGIGDDGFSQMALEDVALMRALPMMGVFQPADAMETAAVMDHLVNQWKGPAYLRLTRQNLPMLYPEGTVIDPLRLNTVVTSASREIVFLGSGAGVAEALKAAAALKSEKIESQVLSVPCLKPFDAKGLDQLTQGAGLIVTVEDHSVIGGLGSIVAEHLSSQATHPPLLQIGVQDVFGESGDPTELYEKFGISAGAIIQKVKTARRGR